MNAEFVRTCLLTLPYVVETRQWGGSLVLWVADKAIGGKMCAVLNPEAPSGSEYSEQALVAFPVSADRFAELVETEGVQPAKYLARLSWVAIHRWDVLRRSEWEQELRNAHAITLAKLAPKTRLILSLAKAEQRRIISERRKLLEARKVAHTAKVV